MTSLSSLSTRVSISCIRNVYQKKVSPKLQKRGLCCRFYPSCSSYTIQALEKYGFWQGWRLGVKRICRCTPKNDESCVDFP